MINHIGEVDFMDFDHLMAWISETIINGKYYNISICTEDQLIHVIKTERILLTEVLNFNVEGTVVINSRELISKISTKGD